MGGFTCMTNPLHQHLHLWDGFQLFSISWCIGPSPVPGFICWQGFLFMPGVILSEVQHFVAPPQPHPEMWTHSSILISILCNLAVFFCSCLLVYYCCTEWFHWASLLVINKKLVGFPHLVITPKSWLIMIWFQHGPGTHQLPSSM